MTASAPAFAGGFYVPEQGARSVAMAGAAVAAGGGEPSAVFHNPAGITGGGKLRAELGGLLVFPGFTYFRRPVADPLQGGAIVDYPAAKNENRLGVVPFLGATTDFGVPDLGVGLAVYVPFGADLVLPENGPQRHVVTKVSLRSIHVTPTVAYRFFKRLSVGLGISYIKSSFQLRQKNSMSFVLGSPESTPNPPSSLEGDTTIEAADNARFGGNFGVLYTDPDDRFALGASLMLPAKLKFEGDVTVTNSPESIVPMNDADGRPLPAGRRDDRVALNVPLPMIVRLGAMVRPIRDVALELDVNFQRWSTTDKMTIFFQHNYPFIAQPGAQMFDVVLDQSYKDTMTVRVGTEITPLGLNGLPLKVRAGALYDQSPIDDRHFDLLTPDSDKIGLSLGAGYVFPVSRKMGLGVDLSYMHLFFAERDIGPKQIGTDSSINQPISGSDRTILNKPAPSFFYGVTRASVDLLALSVSLRL